MMMQFIHLEQLQIINHCTIGSSDSFHEEELFRTRATKRTAQRIQRTQTTKTAQRNQRSQTQRTQRTAAS
jgi:hypothetical protein